MKTFRGRTFGEEFMNKLSGWKVACLAVAGVALSLLAANIVRADSFSDQAAKLDILGVHLGMTPAQAKSVLSQHRKGMYWAQAEGSLRAEADWGFGLNANSRETVPFRFSPPPGDPKVVEVGRDLIFDPSQSPTVENLTNSLTEKFGKPSDESPSTLGGERAFVWAWDKAGQISKPNSSNVCLVRNSGWNLNTIDSDMVYSSSLRLQRDEDGGCAMAVLAI
jgi:hypothetical protein